ncbi:MAG: right-handed parallel beta-helix repeat-containing protein [Phycisphaerales bacterium]|nr:right-handed parallel beta-helix repeat-containing protein [Phycisphaerales bacterium]
MRSCIAHGRSIGWADGCSDPLSSGVAVARHRARDGCTIESVGGSGVWIGAGCRNCLVADCTVRDIGANGIMIGEAAGRVVDGEPWWQSAPNEVASGSAVRQCLIERCGQRFFGAVGVWIGLPERSVVANCEIRDLPYTGVSVGWRWDATPTPCRDNTIEGNRTIDPDAWDPAEAAVITQSAGRLGR